MTRACGADDIKNILYPAPFRKLRFQMIDNIVNANSRVTSTPQYCCAVRRQAEVQ
jgi:hypothetical protein